MTLNITNKIYMMQALVTEITKYQDKPRMKVNVKIPAIDIKLSRPMYGKLQSIGDCFAVSEEQQAEVSSLNRETLKKGCFKKGKLLRKDTFTGFWNSQLEVMIFKGGYLYYFKPK